MDKEDLKQTINIVKNIRGNTTYQKDSDLIIDLYNKLNNLLLDDENITIETLDYIMKNIEYLEIEYDNIFDLTYYFDPVYIFYKRKIHKKYVEELRRTNRDKKECSK